MSSPPPGNQGPPPPQEPPQQPGPPNDDAPAADAAASDTAPNAQPAQSSATGGGGGNRRPLSSLSFFFPFPRQQGDNPPENGDRIGLTWTLEVFANDGEGDGAGGPNVPNAMGAAEPEAPQEGAPARDPSAPMAAEQGAAGETAGEPQGENPDQQQRSIFFVVGPDGRLLPPPRGDGEGGGGVGGPPAWFPWFPLFGHAPSQPDPAKAAELLASLPTVGRALLKRVDQVVAAEDAAGGKEYDERGWRCGICLEGLESMEEAGAAGEAPQPVKGLPCNHLFHEGCLQPWFTSHHTCPTCRLDLDPLRTLHGPRETRANPLRPAATGSGRGTPAGHPYARERPGNRTPAEGSRAPSAAASTAPTVPSTPMLPPSGVGEILTGLFGEAFTASPMPMDRDAAEGEQPPAPAPAPAHATESENAQQGGAETPAGDDRPQPERRPHITILQLPPFNLPGMGGVGGIPAFGLPGMMPGMPGIGARPFNPPTLPVDTVDNPTAGADAAAAAAAARQAPGPAQPTEDGAAAPATSATPATPAGPDGSRTAGDRSTHIDLIREELLASIANARARTQAARTQTRREASNQREDAALREAAGVDANNEAANPPANQPDAAAGDGPPVFHPMRFPLDLLFMRPPEREAPAEPAAPAAPPFVPQSLESWTAQREKGLGWRCDAVECLVAPPVPDNDGNDEAMAPESTGMDEELKLPAADKEMLALYAPTQTVFPPRVEGADPHAGSEFVLLACPHRWHRTCLETAERSAGHFGAADQDGREWVRCARCRKEGWVAPRAATVEPAPVTLA